MNMEIKLGPDDDRVILIRVIDQHGETYIVGLEFCAHHFGPESDDVQVSVKKEVGRDAPQCANAISHDCKRISVRDYPYSLPGVWFEFHKVDGLDAVRTKGEK